MNPQQKYELQNNTWLRRNLELENKNNPSEDKTAFIEHLRNTDPPTHKGVVCYRCLEYGHYANNCPTITDPEWDSKVMRKNERKPVCPDGKPSSLSPERKKQMEIYSVKKRIGVEERGLRSLRQRNSAQLEILNKRLKELCPNLGDFRPEEILNKRVKEL
tara:strand:+ start:3791 stop:4270 length:480 start_codon:yes stop_codon:yes gene_type:complete